MSSLDEKLMAMREASEAFKAADKAAEDLSSAHSEAWAHRHACWEAWVSAAEAVSAELEAGT
jgi:hypothetical protein